MVHSLFTIMPTFVILFWLILFFLDDNKTKAKLILILFLSVALINYTIHWCYFNHNYKIYYILDSLWVFTSLSVYPLYYYYIRYLSKDIKIDYRWSWILFPAIALALFTGAVYIMMSPQEIQTFTSEILYHNKPRSGDYSTLIKLQLLRLELFKIIFTVEVILTVFFGLRLIRQFNKRVMAFYSDVHHRELNNIRITLLFLLVTAIVSLFSNLIGKDFFVDNSYLLAIPSITHSIALFGVSYAGYRQSFSIRELIQDQLPHDDKEPHVEEEKEKSKQKEEKKKEESELFVSFYDELYERMEYLLKEEQVFRNSDLRLNELASQLGTNRTYVSKLINNKENANFCDYINSFRIEYAKELLSSQDEEQLTLDEIALKSGFSSLSSFYRVFTKMEKTSPAKYRVSQAANNNQSRSPFSRSSPYYIF